MADKIATRQAYGEALIELVEKNDKVVVLDADLANATQTCKVAKAHPEKFYNCGIAEANMVDIAAGMSTMGLIPYCSSFAMFAAGRAYEQIRNSIAYPHFNVKICATHAGVSVGEDGGSHQSIEDIALMRVLPNMTVLVPCDALETQKAVRAAAEIEGPVYVRVARPVCPILTGEDTPFVPGKANVLREGKDVAIVATGLMVQRALAAADMLNRRGHSVTVFEREDKIGGLLRYGIPNMKLEKQFIDRKIAIMEEEGIRFVIGCNIGKDKKAATLLKEFDRVVLCCGASNPRDIKVPGREAEGIYFAVDFLKSTTKALWKNAKQNADGTYDLNLKDGTYISAKGKNVMVIGGGDTGNDCVGTSMRHGAKSVLQLEMMPKAPDERTEMNPWPEWPRVCKTDYGQQEAAAVFGHDPRVYQTTVKEFKKDKNGKVCKAVLVKLEPKKNEKTGRMMMTEVAGSEYTVDVDLVLIAAGFLGSQDYVTKAFGVEVNERTNVKTAPGKYDTNVKNVFTAGDMHRGQSLVVWAIREGREAAREVDISLMGYTNMYVQ